MFLVIHLSIHIMIFRLLRGARILILVILHLLIEILRKIFEIRIRYPFSLLFTQLILVTMIGGWLPVLFEEIDDILQILFFFILNRFRFMHSNS